MKVDFGKSYRGVSGKRIAECMVVISSFTRGMARGGYGAWARRALQAGDFATTLRLLDSAAATFPNGALRQEREALAIQALARSGQRVAAAKRAASFLAAYPESPHAADIKAFTR